MTQRNGNGAMPVLALEMDRMGQVRKKMIRFDREGQLENTLVQALYPGLSVATIDIPQEPLDTFEQAQVAQSLAKLECDGVGYALVGASGSAKNGKYYAVEAGYERRIAERFQYWPEAAMTYFGILVSPCQVRIEIPECRVMVVADRELGTNDSRGWIARSVINRLKLPEQRFYQFRLGFEKTQAKGGFKVMEDDVAEKLEADIILPQSSVKPEYKGPSRLLRWLIGGAKTFRGPVVLGIREVSRPLTFESSYTLIEHAGKDSIEMEVKPYALEQVTKLRAAVEQQDFEELFRLLGTSDYQRVFRAGEEPEPVESEYTSVENTILEAVLKADPTGFVLGHPWVNSQLARRFAHWAFKVCTAGGFSLPAFALADDGFLICHQGEVYSGSDWMPKEAASTNLPCRDLLVVRYPIRRKDDLLPLFSLGPEETLKLLVAELQQAGCGMSEAKALDEVLQRQLRLEGTLTLHSETAKRNGGDYDFDWVCVVEGDKFPRFVRDRFGYTEQAANQKNKLKKKQSPWWNLPQVALQAKGNQIGAITDLKTSCVAAGRHDLAEQLALELQAALDQLKHGTKPDREVIQAIRAQVPKAPWLGLKDKERVRDLPVHVEVPPTDAVGELYNFVRKEIQEFFSDETVRPIEDFRGLIAAGHFTREMDAEAAQVNRIYAANISMILARIEAYREALEKAQAELEAVKDDPKARKQAIFKRNQAASALNFYRRERSRQEVKALITFVQKWASQKTANREGWLQALYNRTTCGKGSGSIVFYAFPQEIVDQIVARTGGRPIRVHIPEACDGEVRIDSEGRVFLINPCPGPDGQVQERELFEVQVSPKGEVLRDFGRKGRPVIVERVRPFPIEAGRSVVQNGTVVFPGTVQRPKVQGRKAVN
jgi:hypothetical protein